jgi:hypothetical protein
MDITVILAKNMVPAVGLKVVYLKKIICMLASLTLTPYIIDKT